jgi:hypothetical protein
VKIISTIASILTIPINLVCDLFDRIRKATLGIFKSFSNYFGDRTTSPLNQRVTATAAVDQSEDEVKSEIFSNIFLTQIILDVFEVHFPKHDISRFKNTQVDCGDNKSINSLVDTLENLFKEKLRSSTPETQAQIVAFFKQRREAYLSQARDQAID